MPDPIRLTVVLTHPIQYWTPILRHLAAERPEVALTVLFVTEPTPEQQGQGFGVPFAWDGPLREGYESVVLRPPREGDDYGRYRGLSCEGIEEALLRTRPSVVLLPGWNSVAYDRVLGECRRRSIPTLYRGDTNLWQAPRGAAGIAWRMRARSRLRRFTAWLSVGCRARIFLEEMGGAPHRIHDSPHCVDNERFSRGADAARESGRAGGIRAEAGALPGELLVLFAGKLEPRKRPLDLVRALARVEGGSRLAVAGDGPLREEVRREAASLGVPVAWLGFRNQEEMPAVLASADLLALPSGSESWGLVVNEALAAGTPCVVSDAVGCAPDLVRHGETGETHPVGDIEQLALALTRTRSLVARGAASARACRSGVAGLSPSRAVEGILAAGRQVLAGEPGGDPARVPRWPRVVVSCQGMATLGGLERVTLDVAGVLAGRGARIHCVVSGWPSFRSRVVGVAERSGFGWSTGGGREPLRARPRPAQAVRMAGEVLGSSLALLRAARRIRATHLLLPTEAEVLRGLPGILLLRMAGVRTVLRVGTRPVESPLFRALWRRLAAPLVARTVYISRYVAGHHGVLGVSPRRGRVILNSPSTRRPSADPGSRDGRTVVFAGQVIPGKGLHNLIEAVGLLRREGLDCRLRVLGAVDGWESPSTRGYRAALVRAVEEGGLGGHVEFLGWREDVPGLLAEADIHCCPSEVSLGEGLGTVVLEAKAAGIPSVVTPSGGLPELVRHGVDGWVCAGDRPRDLADGLRPFLVEAGVRAAAGAAARSSLEDRFGREAFEEAWWEVFAR